MHYRCSDTCDAPPNPDDICRAQPLRGDTPCPRCGYVSAGAPSWADHGVTFALNGTRYRIVSVGSTNRYAPRHLHFEDIIGAERLDSAHWELPAAPCPTSDVKAALGNLFALPHFRAHELAAAIRSV